MRELDNLCVNCWGELTEGSVCTNCGYDNDFQNETMYLPTKTILQEKYIVGTVQKHESDAVTYLGYDGQLDRLILIRELYPKGIANRLEGNTDLHIRQRYVEEYKKLKQSYYRLWTTLEKLHSLSAVTPVYDVFEANGTVYAIIEDMDCISLRDFLLRNEMGYITWESARVMLMPVLTTLESLHSSGIVHGSVSPDNLLLCRDGKVRLAPFPITQSCDSSTILEFTENEGYTALEQYDNSHKICAATDIYSFSACIYRALVGTNPPSAVSREANDKLMIPNTIAENIPIHVIKALVSGLQVYPEKRIKTIEAFRELLDAAPAVQAKTIPQEDIYQEGATGGYPDDSDLEKSEKKRRIVAIILAILIVVAIAVTVYVVKFSGLINKSPEEQPSQQVAQTYEVPNFVNNGYTQSDIQNKSVWNEQFNFVFKGEYSADTEEGIIFKQSVEPGTKVMQGSDIVLTVSKGVQTEQVPNVSGLTLEEATKKLQELGFKVSTVEVYNDGLYTEGTVKSTTGVAPAPGSVVAVGEEIILQVYGKAEPTTEPTTEPDIETTVRTRVTIE